jgi:lipopolysaccharide transport system ATP-binding protein
MLIRSTPNGVCLYLFPGVLSPLQASGQMSDVVISVDNLSKIYRIGTMGSDAIGAYLRRAWARTRGTRATPQKADAVSSGRLEGIFFKALQDVNFEVRHGEALGIIGQNGAGKSTLLKILSRVTAPTTGSVKVKGDVASLLEVGTGFHPDLTGRENIFLNGAILGMSRREILGKFDEIVDFSGVEEFIDTPVKRYSSGMYVRLAFAVAAHLEPEILIMDEVLAVGDAAFQRKCLGKMGEAAKQGRTVLFVSHNMVAVQSLCSRALLLVDGRVAANGPPVEVVPHYLASGFTESHAERVWADPAAAPGNDLVRIAAVRAGPATDVNGGLISMQTPVLVEIEYRRLQADRVFHLEFHLVNQEEVVLFYDSPGLCPAAPGFYRSSCTIPGNLLNSGGYRLKLMLVEDESRAIWLDEATTSFSVEDLQERKIGWMARRPGAIYLPLEWETVMSGSKR